MPKFDNGVGVWKPILGRPLIDWELDVQNFLRLLSNRISHMEKDRLIWKGVKNGKYYVRANFDILEEEPGGTVPLKII